MPGACIPNSRKTVPQVTLVWSLGAIPLGVVFSAVSQAATVIAVSQVHFERPAGVMDSFLKVKNQIFGVIAVALSVGFLVGLGFIALIVPGILLARRWSLTVPVKVLESKGIGEAMSRSSQLSLARAIAAESSSSGFCFSRSTSD